MSPSTSLYDKSEAILKCTVGESSGNLNLLLTLQHHDGSIVELGYDAVKKAVTLNDNNATFICHMTSKTFPMAYRNCSAGPIAVQEMLGTPNKDTKKIHSTYRIIIGNITALLLVIIGAIISISIITLRKSTLEESNSVHIPAIIAMRNSTRHRNKPAQDISSNLTCRQGNSEQIPDYAEIEDPNSHLRENTITYADSNLSIFPEETVNFPIYSEVKDTEETDLSNNEADDEDSTGMIENTIYVSSGPV